MFSVSSMMGLESLRKEFEEFFPPSPSVGFHEEVSRGIMADGVDVDSDMDTATGLIPFLFFFFFGKK